MVAGESLQMAQRPYALDVDADLSRLAHREEGQVTGVAEIEEERRPIAFRLPREARLPVFSVLECEFPGGEPDVLGQEPPQREAGAAEAGPGAGRDEPRGSRPLVGTQERDPVPLVAGGEVDSPYVKVRPRKPRVVGRPGPFPRVQRVAYQSRVSPRPGTRVWVGA